jgi:nitrile hydratase beta subunit
MNGVHDMGGLQSFGPVRPEPNELPFHAPWEKRALALTLAMGATGSWNIDQARAARESLPPGTYLTSSYYKIWIEGLTKLMLERGFITQAELASGRMQSPPAKLARILRAADVSIALARGAPTVRETTGVPRFKAGDEIRTRNWNPATHTRLPRYCRDKPGAIEKVRGCHVFADANAQGDPRPEWLYSVRFEARDLWGEHTTASAVYVDLWEPYLEGG